jgi:Domain of unknown function (DUF4440)
VDAEQLEQLERARLRALRECDLVAVERLHAEDYELVTPGGGTLTRQDYVELITSGEFTYTTFEPASPVRVRDHGSAAVIRYRARIVVSDATGEIDSGLFWHTDIWELRSGSWQAVWSHATRIRQIEDQAES